MHSLPGNKHTHTQTHVFMSYEKLSITLYTHFIYYTSITLDALFLEHFFLWLAGATGLAAANFS